MAAFVTALRDDAIERRAAASEPLVRFRDLGCRR
jgi:hypothetical protein